MTEKYDLYKCYGLLKLMQEKQQDCEMLLKEVYDELKIKEDEQINHYIDVHFENAKLTIDRVKEICDQEYSGENKGNGDDKRWIN